MIFMMGFYRVVIEISCVSSFSHIKLLIGLQKKSPGICWLDILNYKVWPFKKL